MKAIYYSPIGEILIESSEIGITALIFADGDEMTSHGKKYREMTSAPQNTPGMSSAPPNQYEFDPPIAKPYKNTSDNQLVIKSAMGNDDKFGMSSQCASQLDEYFSGRRKTFDLPLDLRGTEFQVKVWKELLKIPFGRTISYKELSLRLGDVRAIRAVGTANGANPVSIVVPCHRVIGSDGSLTGYGGGIWRKKWLLQHEGAFLPELGFE